MLDKVVRSIAIDSYVNESNENLLFLLLDNYGISKENPIDMLIWTHPDTDHCKGMCDVITKYADKKTIVIVTEGARKWTMFTECSKQIYNHILSQYKKKNIQLSHANVSPLCYPPNKVYMYIRFGDDNEEEKDFYIEILTPFEDDATRQTEANATFQNNDISISFVVHFGDLQLYFGGDAENAAIRRVEVEKYSNLQFIKIPHHGSKSSIVLPQIISEYYDYTKEEVEGYENDDHANEAVSYYYDECSEDVISNIDEPDETASDIDDDVKNKPHILSVSTCFHIGSAHDPEDFVLNLYKSFSKKIYLTDYEKPRNNKYGICKFEYDIKACECRREECLGDAGVFYVHEKVRKMCDEYNDAVE